MLISLSNNTNNQFYYGKELDDLRARENHRGNPTVLIHFNRDDGACRKEGARIEQFGLGREAKCWKAAQRRDCFLGSKSCISEGVPGCRRTASTL